MYNTKCHKIMSDAKTYIFGENGGNSMLSALAPLLNKSGIDPNVLLAMNNGNGFGGNGNWLWIIFLFFIWGWGGNRGWNTNGNGQDGLAALINNDNGRDLLMSAIQGNGTAISQLASTLNCSITSVQQSINSLMSTIQGVGNQVGLSSMQIVNAVQTGNTTIASQIAQCCCDNKLLVTQQGYENRIANAEQTSILGSKIDQQTTMINDRFCQLEMRELQNKIDALREERSTLQAQISNSNQTAAIQQYVAAVVSPISKEVVEIKAAMPATTTIQYSPVVGIPSCVAAQYGLANYSGMFTNGGQWL